MDPIDYTSAFNNLPSPQASFMQGVQNGVSLRQAQMQAQQQRAAAEQQQQMQSDMADLAANPTTEGIAKLTIKYPALSEPFKRTYDMLAPAEQQTALQHATQVYAALDNDRPDIAKQVVLDKAAALRNSGNEPAAKAAEAQAKLIETDPVFAKITTGKMVASMAGGDKFISSMATMGQEERAAEQAPAALRTANAKAGAEEADVTTKNLSLVAQQAGALAKPGVKPAQAITMFKSLEARGIIPKGGAQGYIDGIPSSDKDLPDYLASVRDAGIKPDDQKKFTTPDANASLQSETSVKTAAISAAASRYSADSSARTAANRLTFDKDQADAEDAPDTTSDAEKKNWVHQFVAGNGSVPRSAPANVRNHIGTWAAEMGITPADLSSGSAQAKFDQAAAGTSGHRAGSMASVEATMPALTANARDLSHQLDQGRFVPLNQLIQMADDKISDPKLAAFKVGHQAVVSEYQQVISRGGTNVTALKEAMHALNSARSREAYDAALNQVDKEVAINVAGTKAVRAGLGGQHGAAPTPPPAPALPAGWSVKEH